MSHKEATWPHTVLGAALPVIYTGTVSWFAATGGRGVGVVDTGASTALFILSAGQVGWHAGHTCVDITRSCVHAVLSAALLILSSSTVVPTLDTGTCMPCRRH